MNQGRRQSVLSYQKDAKGENHERKIPGLKARRVQKECNHKASEYPVMKGILKQIP